MKHELEQAGLTKNQAAVYIELCDVGMSTAYRVAKESKIFKANTYDALNDLVAMGLVSTRKVDGRMMYEAADPSAILDMLDAKKEKIGAIIPSLRLKQQMTKTETGFNVYKGVDAFIRIFYDFLEFNEPILVYGAPKKAYEIMKHRIDHFHAERIKRKIKQCHIYNFEAKGRILQIRDMPYTPVRCLPELFDSQVATHICGDEVVFVIWEPPVKVIQIKDKDMAEAYKRYFRILWKKAKAVA